MSDEALRLLVEQFWLALGYQQEWLEEPQRVDDYVYRMRTQPGFIFDDTFWETFHSFAFKIWHVVYYGPERLEDGERAKDEGVLEIRFGFLAQPIPAAREAVLARALERVHRRLQHEVIMPTYEQREARSVAAKVADVVQEEIGSLYADTSQAAAALLP